MTSECITVDHLTHYRYSEPVTSAQHLALLQPLHDAWQERLSFTLDIHPAPDSPPGGGAGSTSALSADAFGNRPQWFTISTVHTVLTVRARSRVRLTDPPLPPKGPSCLAAAHRLRYHPRQPWEPAAEFAQPSPFIPLSPEIQAWARRHVPTDLPVLHAAEMLMQVIHQGFTYRSHSTTIDTPLTQVLTQRAGVCQDFAHLMIAALRACGIAARYVSGYLLTESPAGQPALVGADASHAWVQVWIPGETPEGSLWVDFDPTNGVRPHRSHVRLAVGRDFGDVTPLRGVIRGGGQHVLEVGVTTRLETC